MATLSHGTDDRVHTPRMGGGGGTPHRKNTKNSITLDLMTFRSLFGAAISYIQGRVTLDTIRPLHMFLGLSPHNLCFAPEAFGPPMKKLDKSSPEKFNSRLRLNMSFFLSNYAVVTAGVSLVTMLMHPGMLVSVGLLWILWTAHHFLISNEVIVMGRNIGTILSMNQRSMLLSVLTFFVVVWKCLRPTIMAIAISSLLIFVHAILRDPKHIDTSSSSSSTGSTFGKNDSDDEEVQSSDSEVLVERPHIRKDVV